MEQFAGVPDARTAPRLPVGGDEKRPAPWEVIGAGRCRAVERWGQRAVSPDDALANLCRQLTDMWRWEPSQGRNVTHTPRAGGAKDGGARMGPMSIHVCLCALPRRSAKRPPGCLGRCSFDHSIRNETANGALGFDDSLQFRTARLYAGERVRFSSRTTDGARPVQRLKAYLKEVGRS